MFLNIFFLAAESGSSLTQTVLALLIPGAISVIVVILTNKATRREKKDQSRTDMYKVELEQINRQRELVTIENEKLRDDLKEELEDCRKLRHTMENSLEELKRKMNTIEAELFAYRNGFKTPGGYILVKVAEGTIKEAPALDQTKKNPLDIRE